MEIILIIILVVIFSLFTHNLAGEGGGLSKGDERQKILFKDASITS
ncbi:hypothetical protein ACQKOD_27555 [Bacillus mycoides]